MERKKKIINEIDNIHLKGLKWAECGKVLHGCICDKRTSGLKAMLSNIRNIKDIFRMNSYSVMQYNRGSILFLYLANNLNNPHAYTKMKKAADLVENKIELRTNGKKKFNIYIYTCILVLIWYVQLKRTDLSRSERLYLAFQLYSAYIEYQVVKKKMKTSLHNVSLVVSIHDARMEDNILMQFFKTRNIHTVTLCHGAFRLPQDEEDYTCSVSEYFMVCDKTMEKEAITMGITAQQIVKVSQLQYIGKKFCELEYNSTLNCFGIFLNHPVGRENNLFLLECGRRLANEYNFTYYVKPHPSDDITSYIDKIEKERCIGIWSSDDLIDNCISKIAFGLVGTQSIMFSEILFNGKWALRGGMKTEPDTYGNISEMRFATYDELKSEYEKCRKEKYVQNVIDKISEEYFMKISGEKVYQNFFENFE